MVTTLLTEVALLLRSRGDQVPLELSDSEDAALDIWVRESVNYVDRFSYILSIVKWSLLGLL